MHAILVGLAKTVGGVVWGMVVELVTARFIRKTVKQGLQALARKTETKEDDKLVENATKEWDKQEKD